MKKLYHRHHWTHSKWTWTTAEATQTDGSFTVMFWLLTYWGWASPNFWWGLDLVSYLVSYVGAIGPKVGVRLSAMTPLAPWLPDPWNMIRPIIALFIISEGYAHDCIAKARFPLPELTARVNGPSWPGDRFPLPVNTGRVDGCAFPLAVLTGRQHGPSTRLVETGLNLCTGTTLVWARNSFCISADTTDSGYTVTWMMNAVCNLVETRAWEEKNTFSIAVT